MMNYIDWFDGLTLVRCVCGALLRSEQEVYLCNATSCANSNKKNNVCSMLHSKLLRNYLDHTTLQVLLSYPLTVQGGSLSVSITQSSFIEKSLLAESVSYKLTRTTQPEQHQEFSKTYICGKNLLVTWQQQAHAVHCCHLKHYSLTNVEILVLTHTHTYHYYHLLLIIIRTVESTIVFEIT